MYNNRAIKKVDAQVMQKKKKQKGDAARQEREEQLSFVARQNRYTFIRGNSRMSGG